MFLRSLLLFFFSLLISMSYSQRLVFENLGINNGLPATETYNLHQDQFGYVWVFTEYGIVKHNGRSFVKVCTNLSLDRSAIYAVAENSNRELFIANSKRELFQVIDDKAYKVYGIESASKGMAISDSPILRLFFDDFGTLWISSSGRSYRFTSDQYWLKGQKNKKKKFKKRKNVAISTIVWGVKEEDVRKPNNSFFKLGFVQSNGKHYHNWFGESNHQARRVSAARYGSSSYLSKGELIHGYVGKKKIGPINLKHEIIDLKIGRNGHLWVALVNGGLCELDENLNVVNRYFSQITVSNILFDNQNGLWITTIGEGVFHCRNINRLSFYNVSEVSHSVSMMKRVNNHFFIGTQNGNMFVLKGNKLKCILKNSELTISDITYLNGKYYVAGKRKLIILNDDFSAHRDSKCPIFPYFLSSFNAQSLIIANDFRLFNYNTKSDDTTVLFDTGRMRHLIQIEKDDYMVMDGNRVSRITNGKLTYPDYLKPLTNKHVSRIKKDTNKNIWFCTKGYGVFRLSRTNHLVHFPNLPVNIVNDISFIDGKHAILSTNQGAYVNRVDFDRNQKSWERFMSREVLFVEEINNQIYFGTKSGVIVSRVDELINKSNAKFYLTSVVVKGKELSKKTTYEFNYHQNDLSFHYDFLDYQFTAVPIKYELSGTNDLVGWATENQIHLQNLPPGNYKLTVYPKLTLLSAREQKVVTEFTVYPAYWQTTAFLVVSILLGLVLSGLIFYLVFKRNLKKRDIKEQMERLLTEHRLTALKAQINPHFMSNSLVAIQQLILEGRIDNANLYLAKFSLLLRSLLDYSSKSAASIKDELEMIQLYVELEQLRFSNLFVYELNIDPDIDLNETYIPALITQTFVENAIWHGLLPLQGSRQPKLTMGIYFSGDDLVISIVDNGVGREFHNQLKSIGRKSKGSQLIIDRIQNMNKLYQTTRGAIVYVDLLDDAGFACGTEVKILLPHKIIDALAEDQE